MFQFHRFGLAATAATAAALAAGAPASHAASPPHAGDASASSHASSSPYAGQETRDIKALSPQEVQSLLAGRGMGFAKTAELNGLPGPAHVLELAAELSLSDEQRRRSRALFEAMQRDAIALGRVLVESERELDRLFATRTVTSQSLQASLARSGELQSRLRGVHLQAHIEQARILDAAQVERYSVLRGYGDGQAEREAHGSHAGHGDHGTPADEGDHGSHAGRGGHGSAAVEGPDGDHGQRRHRQ